MLFRRTRSIVAVAALFAVVLQSAPAFAAPPVCSASGQPFPELISFERTSAPLSAIGRTVTTQVGASGGVRPLRLVVNFLKGEPAHAPANQLVLTVGNITDDADTGTTSGVVQAGQVLGSGTTDPHHSLRR